MVRQPQQGLLDKRDGGGRLRTGKHILEHFHAGAHANHASFDPCSSLLAKTLAKLEGLQVAAMGPSKWASPRSHTEGQNARASGTAKNQAGSSALQVYWTPVLARGQVAIYVCDPDADGASAPKKLNDAAA